MVLNCRGGGAFFRPQPSRATMFGVYPSTIAARTISLAANFAATNKKYSKSRGLAHTNVVVILLFKVVSPKTITVENCRMEDKTS
jgi:hypothetical protein